MTQEEWMTIEETARYLQLGKTALYDLAREGRFRQAKSGANGSSVNETWTRGYSRTSPSTNSSLRLPRTLKRTCSSASHQVEAYKALYEYLKTGKNPAIIQIPVGCGKSGVAAIPPSGSREAGANHRAEPHDQGRALRGAGHHEPAKVLLAESGVLTKRR